MLRQFLVVLVFQNGVFSFNNDLDSTIPTSTLLKLINKVIQNHKNDNLRYETIKDEDYTEEDKHRIDLDYYDFNNNYYKKTDDVSSDLWEVDEEVPGGKEVRIHVIDNPEVLEQYKKNILHLKRHSLGTKQKLVPKIFKSLTFGFRRNSVGRLDSIPSDNNKPKGKIFNTDIMQKHSQYLTKKQQSKYGDDMFEPKRGNNWDIETKTYKDNNRENNSKERYTNTKDLGTSGQKISHFEEDYQKIGKKSKPKKVQDSNYNKKTNSKPKVNNNYKGGYKQLDVNFKPTFNSKPLRLSKHIKPHYKPFNSEEKRQSKHNYREPIKPKAYKETYFQPKIQKNLENNYHNYRPREKRVHIDRGNSVFSSGRTPIPYAGHRGVYED